jgi:signal transduction histidine kinase
LEEEWVDAGTRRRASYSYLPPGTYRFHVQACNNDGVWNEKGASMALIVLPYFWQKWWFRLAAATGVILIFVAAYEMRLASERKLARLRLRIARDLHDEVGSNLGSIVLLSQVMHKSSRNGSEEVSEIRQVAEQTIESLRDIVWFLDPAGEKIEEVVPRMHDTARRMLPAIPIEWHWSAHEGPLRWSLELRRNLFPVFKEILHNIGKHSQATRVVVAAEFYPRHFQLRISDNGKGFDETKVRLGNGLRNLRRRAAEMGGSLSIEPRPGDGVTVTLLVPSRKHGTANRGALR